MTVEKLIKKLEACNPLALVTIVVGTEEENSIDTSEFEIHGSDLNEYIEVFVKTEEQK